ncbi:hypothetical protein EZS27_040010, partial [termite gut metagenome]
MPLPEYGRSIQNMVDHALTIEDRTKRQFCAKTIIGIMGNMYPHFRDAPEFAHKLWDHLVIMSDFQLDIDYPYEVIKKDNLITKHERVPYPRREIRRRYYGYIIEVLIKRFKISHVFILFFCRCFFGKGRHHSSQRTNIIYYKQRIRMS